MKRKLFAVSMAAAMATSCFAGTAFASDSEPVTIKVTRACFNLANPDSEQVKKVQDAINEYIKDKINVQIELTDIGSGEYTEKANLALANNEINLLWTASWEATIGTNDLVPANAVYDITDLLPGTPLYESMDEGQWEATKYDGKNYFVPVYKDNVEGYDVMFRKDLVDKYGWDISSVKTLADIEPMLADLEAEGLKYPYLSQKTAMFYRYYINDFDFFTADSQSNWVAVDRSTNEVVDTVLTDQYKEFCTLMAKWAEAGYISEDEVTKTTTDTTTQTQDWGISWWTDIPVNAEANSRYNQEVVMTPITDRWAHSTSALGSCYAVTANSTPEEAQACVDFLGLLYTDSKLADLYTFGIEGEDFNYLLDDSLADIPLIGYIPYTTKRNALVQIAFSIGAVVDTSNYDGVLIYPQQTEVTGEFSEVDTYDGVTMEHSDVVTGIRLMAHTYQQSEDTEELYNDTLSGTAEVIFSDPHYGLTITGGTLLKSGDNYAVISGTGSAVVLTGKKYIHMTTALLKENPTIVFNRNVKEVSDATLVHPGNAPAVLERVYEYYQRAENVTGDVLLTDKTLGQVVGIDTGYDGRREGTIESISYQFGIREIKAEVVIHE